MLWPNAIPAIEQLYNKLNPSLKSACRIMRTIFVISSENNVGPKGQGSKKEGHIHKRNHN